MKRDQYQGFEITAEAQRAKFPTQASTCYAYAYRPGSDDAVFAVAMTIEDRFAWSEAERQLEPDEVSGWACDFALRWAHGLIDLDRWDGQAEFDRQLRSLGSQSALDHAITDDDLLLYLLRAIKLMDPIANLHGYAARLDVVGFADVLRVDASRVQIALVELASREWLKAYAYEERIEAGNVKLTPAGWAELDRREGDLVAGTDGLEIVGADVFAFVAGADFGAAYPAASQKLREALALLLADDPVGHAGEIGFSCRRAGQEFADVLVARFAPPDAPEERSLTKSRIDAVLRLVKPRLGARVYAALDALNLYWDAVVDLHQRQSHPEQRDRGQELNPEDCRAVVFQTAFAMHEIERALRDL